MGDPIRTETGTIAIVTDRTAADNLTTLSILGPLTQATRDLFKRLVLEELLESRLNVTTPMVQIKFRLDFTHCTDLDTMGIGALVTVAKRIREAGGLVHATGLSGDIGELFRLTKLDQVIAIEPVVANG